MEYTPTELEKGILATVTYFDLFSYPVTPVEVWKWRTGNDAVTLQDVMTTLTTSAYLQERLQSSEGFYFLRGRGDNVAIRKERYQLAERKYRRVLKAVRAFRFLPFIKMVAVCNTLAFSNTRDDGDLDLLIVTTSGKIWTVRWLTAGLAALLGWRPTSQHTRDSICLSFFLSEANLDLRTLQLDGDDIYLRYWLDQLVPVYGDLRVYAQLRAANQSILHALPNAYGTQPAPQRWVRDVAYSRATRAVIHVLHRGWLGSHLELLYRRLQHRMLPLPLRILAEQPDSRVVLSDAMLKFHENDRRAQYARQFSEQLSRVA